MFQHVFVCPLHPQTADLSLGCAVQSSKQLRTVRNQRAQPAVPNSPDHGAAAEGSVQRAAMGSSAWLGAERGGGGCAIITQQAELHGVALLGRSALRRWGTWNHGDGLTHNSLLSF